VLVRHKLHQQYCHQGALVHEAADVAFWRGQPERTFKIVQSAVQRAFVLAVGFPIPASLSTPLLVCGEAAVFTGKGKACDISEPGLPSWAADHNAAGGAIWIDKHGIIHPW
jgi:hypothetical protein